MGVFTVFLTNSAHIAPIPGKILLCLPYLHSEYCYRWFLGPIRQLQVRWFITVSLQISF